MNYVTNFVLQYYILLFQLYCRWSSHSCNVSTTGWAAMRLRANRDVLMLYDGKCKMGLDCRNSKTQSRKWYDKITLCDFMPRLMCIRALVIVMSKNYMRVFPGNYVHQFDT